MRIIVICPSCNARLQISEKYAGRHGLCPKCKELIAIPAAPMEIKIHEPDPDDVPGGKSRLPKIQLLPRVETKLHPAVAAGVAAAVLVSFGIALALRGTSWKSSPWLLALGALLVAPPAVLGGYTFLRNQDLEPYRGRELAARAGICAAVYVVLWAIIWGLQVWFVPADSTLEGWSILFLLAPTMALGTVASWAALDLDPGSGFFHCCLYLGVCVLLRITMGLPAL